MENKKEYDLNKIMRIGIIMFVITAVVLVIMCAVSVVLKNTDLERDGYAVISYDGYTDTIYFTSVRLSTDSYFFTLEDGSIVICHCDRVVIYYDDDKE